MVLDRQTYQALVYQKLACRDRGKPLRNLDGVAGDSGAAFENDSDAIRLRSVNEFAGDR
jgi:hypothetical protein